MKTPYAHVVNVSWQRQLPAGFVLEASYLGRFSRNTLQQIDLAQPLDLVDPKSGMDYFTAATELSKYGYEGATTVPAIPYFEDMFPGAASGGMSATQNIYNNIWRYTLGNETAALYALDILCYPNCGGPTTGAFLANAIRQHVHAGRPSARPTTTVDNCCCAAPWPFLPNGTQLHLLEVARHGLRRRAHRLFVEHWQQRRE